MGSAKTIYIHEAYKDKGDKRYRDVWGLGFGYLVAVWGCRDKTE